MNPSGNATDLRGISLDRVTVGDPRYQNNPQVLVYDKDTASYQLRPLASVFPQAVTVYGTDGAFFSASGGAATNGNVVEGDAQGGIKDSGTALSSLVTTARTIGTTAPLTGGGNLSADLTLAVSSATSGDVGVSKPDNTSIKIATGVLSTVIAPAKTVTKAADYTAVAGDVVLCDTSVAGFTVTLPASSANGSQPIWVKKVSSDGNTLTIARTGSDLIDGATSQVITAQWGSLSLIGDGVLAWGIF